MNKRHLLQFFSSFLVWFSGVKVTGMGCAGIAGGQVAARYL
jgi:hypothetical protein